MKLLLFFALAITLVLPKEARCDNSREVWEKISEGIDETDLKTASIDPNDTAVIYVGSAKSIFKSPDNGKTWKRLYIVRGTSTAVNVIAIDPADTNVVYAGTQNGLLQSLDKGNSWNQAFEGIGFQEKNIRHMTIDPLDAGKLYIGTENGLFISNDRGKTWNKAAGEISNQGINFVVVSPADPNIIYAAVTTGVFKSLDGGASWNRIFFATAQGDETETEETSQDSNTDETLTYSNKTPNCIAIDNLAPDTIYVGTNTGVFISSDAGKTFGKMTSAGLINRKITSLLSLNNSVLFAATQSGIFKIEPPYLKWHEVYNGLSSKDIRYFAYNAHDNSVLAVAKKGVYKLRSDPTSIAHDPLSTEDPEIEKILEKFEAEPTIRETQEIAVKYAEVHKEKIDSWRRAAKGKAVLPDLSVGMSRYLTDYYHWDSGTNPDTLQKGKTIMDWSVNVSWDLGDMIWSTDQTSIDARSRLMVQLRDDILNEVTQLYFERRRLQIELLTSPPKNIQHRLNKQLRLQELTAGIDALTGGWFSEKGQGENK